MSLYSLLTTAPFAKLGLCPFSADEDFIESRFGKLKPDKLRAVLYTLFTVLTRDD